MSNGLRELCSLLIEDVYGEFYAHIFSILQSCGRLTAHTLAKKCHLPLRHVHHGLAGLVQLGLVFHFTTGEGRTSYEANSQNAYSLARSGKVVDVVEKRHGPVAACIVTQLLLLGHATVTYLKESTSGWDSSATMPATDTQVTGVPSAPDSAKANQSGNEVDDALRNLCQDGLVGRLRRSHHRTNADNRQIAETKVESQPFLSTAKGTKLRDEISARVGMEMNKQDDISIRLPKTGLNNVTQKRRGDEFDPSGSHSKRTKLATKCTAETEVSDRGLHIGHGNDILDGKLVVRLNLGKFAVLLRNSLLVSSVTSAYGADVSRTYGAVLEQMNSRLFNITANTQHGLENERWADMLLEVDESFLARALASPAVNNLHQGSRIIDVNGSVNGTTGKLSLETYSHLDILCQAPFNYLLHSTEHPKGYTIDYANLAIDLRNIEVFRIILARFDRYAVRIIRVLLIRGKVDEKHLQEIILMSVKELRQTLALLHQAGFVELQEVPREAQRQPSRTMYLWFYDADRVRQMLTEDTYKCMARCMQRMKLERRNVKPTVEKSERTDVKEQEANLLSKAELRVLKEWRWKEEWLLAELGRLDYLIYVLNDF